MLFCFGFSVTKQYKGRPSKYICLNQNDHVQALEVKQAVNRTAPTRSQQATVCPGPKAAAAPNQAEAQARSEASEAAHQQQQQHHVVAEAAEHAAAGPPSQQQGGLPGSGSAQPGVAPRPEQAAGERVTDAAEEQPVNLPPPQCQPPIQAQGASKMNTDGAGGSHATATEQDTNAERQTPKQGPESGSAALHSQVSTCCPEHRCVHSHIKHVSKAGLVEVQVHWHA